MEVSLQCHAEIRAKESESLNAFGGINLLHVKRQLSVLLGLIGREGIFDEYTVHDISHIDEMVRVLDWLIPTDTQSLMSPADWLVIVLSIYFHDLGMLVTREEYDRRGHSHFPEFCNQVLFMGDEGFDYKVRIDKLSPDRHDRFLYQEFVRQNHAERVRNWILGRESDHLGISHKTMKEVDSLLKPLGPQFRRDLGVICESHHLDDLGDLNKYKVAQPYGNSDAETANLQYAAVILRSADLFHITSDRTPSVAFRILSPSDPISQEEWAKQQAVKRVRPKMGLDKEGKPDPKAAKDTIEVHAYFTSPEGFFGLTSYLSYAQKQIAKSHEWIEGTRRKNLANHDFPWIWIDEANIETQGFIRDTFEFRIDQARILDLLTGHTLYNDSRVVLRELVQNSLDAVRLQERIDHTFTDGRVEIVWNTKDRVLSVQDNGTGMTQKIITDYLLTVGSSRYQDPDFKKEFPDFCPISRFGIGVLTTFMIADTVEVATCHPEEEQARHLSLRSVHGKYLIRLLDKDTAPEIAHIKPHGTLFTLHVRPSVEVPNVLRTAHEWIVIPGCTVTVKIDDGEPQQVGFSSPKRALEGQLRRVDISVVDDDTLPSEGGMERLVRVIERAHDGICLAFAVQWNPWFREWSLLTPPKVRSEEKELLLGTCISGIRVDFNTPGYNKSNIAAIANLSGPSAPRTNVARYGLENTPDRDNALAGLYTLFFSHVVEEMEKLRSRRNFSLTWAAQEAQYLLLPLFGKEWAGRDESKPEPVSPSVFRSSLKTVPILVVETGGARRTYSVDQLHASPAFWTVDCALCRSVECLLREIPTESSLLSVTTALTSQGIGLPAEQILCTSFVAGEELESLVFADREVDRMVIRQQQRRVDLRWAAVTEPPRWFSPSITIDRLMLPFSRAYLPFRRSRMSGRNWLIGVDGIDIQSEEQVTAVLSHGNVFIMPDSALAKYFRQLFKRVEKEQSPEQLFPCFAIIEIASILFNSPQTIENVPELLDFVERELNSTGLKFKHSLKEIIDVQELLKIIGETRWVLFDPSAWQRKSSE